MENTSIFKGFMKFTLLVATLTCCYIIIKYVNQQKKPHFTNIHKSANTLLAYQYSELGSLVKKIEVGKLNQQKHGYDLFEIKAVTKSKLGSWSIDAKEGTWKKNKHLLHLKSGINAYVKNENFNGKIITNEIEINTTNKTASNNIPVKIESSEGNITAVGMLADFNKQSIKLLSNIKGFYKIKEGDG